jgi:predicted nucleotidyltransferase
MATQPRPLDWTPTEEKVSEVLRRIIAHANPVQIIAFGSRVRGDHQPDSDLDLAVIVDETEAENRNPLPYVPLRGVGMIVDLIVVSRQHYDHFRPWLNSVFNYIHKDGIVLYDREHPESASTDALHLGGEPRVDPSISIA